MRRRTDAQAQLLQGDQDKAFRPESLNLELVLEQGNLGPAPRHDLARKCSTTNEPKQYPPPNQFVVLFHSLLLADLHQAVAFFLNIVWVARDGISVESPACWAQGLFMSNGDLASSCFIFIIALHTYLSLVREYRLPQRALYAWIAGTWIFIYGIGLAGVVFTDNGREFGGYFVRASAWCWISEDYEELRLLTHYLYIFFAIVFPSLLYLAVFASLRSRLSHSQLESGAVPDSETPRPALRHKTSRLSVMSPSPQASSSPLKSPPDTQPGPQINADHHRAFLIYPVIYGLCTLPLAAGRIVAMMGVHVPLGFFCAAGALIVSNGWLDVLLWGTTRHTIVFGRLEDADTSLGLGLDTFDFMRTPPDRRFGKFVWVLGASASDNDCDSDSLAPGTGTTTRPGRWLRRLRRAHQHQQQRHTEKPSMSGITGADMGMTIQKDTMVTVVKEDSDSGHEVPEALRGWMGRHTRNSVSGPVKGWST
ncbi:integral membrane protein [Diaporthe helianthi]|uniref:Integral membrane protein n=1 Tax=Diaporthe helianthi TaxID=158607 RepID=A0A2P5I366_DIAHE|nr:integral membrane protein [Diaporthe helianthi]